MKWFLMMMLSVAVALGAPSQRIGQPLEMTDVYIPGGEAKPSPRRDRESPLVVRLLDVKPAQDGHRYDFEIQGLDAGKYDLSQFLVAVDPAVPPRFPEIPLEITAGLAGIEMPGMGKVDSPQGLGGYAATLAGIALFWVLGLGLILFWMKRKPWSQEWTESAPTLAERMKPLLDRAASGNLGAEDRALLERMILGHWRARLPEIRDKSPVAAMSELRSHPEASPLLSSLEKWLHAPAAEITPDEIERLLSTYR